MNVMTSLCRCAHCISCIGLGRRGLVTFLTYPPDDLVLAAPSAARLHGIRAGSAPGAPGRASRVGPAIRSYRGQQPVGAAVAVKCLACQHGQDDRELKASSPTSAIMTSGSHSCWRLAAYRGPAWTPLAARRPRTPGRSITSAAITATYDTALTAKHGVVPIVTISTRARAGPTTRALFITTPLRLTALDKSPATIPVRWQPMQPGGSRRRRSVKTTAAKSATATRRHCSASPGKSTSPQAVQLSSRHRA